MVGKVELQEILEEAPAQRENLREFIDKLVNEGYTVADIGRYDFPVGRHLDEDRLMRLAL